MNKMSSSVEKRFQDDADKYATYLETPEGRLRLDLAFANVQELLPQATRSLHALDLGGGTGALAVRLARLGFHVTLLDTLSSVDKGVPQLPELGRLVARVSHLALKNGHDRVEPWGHLCLACPGFSALVTGRRGSEERSVLFDVGPSAEVTRLRRW